MHFSSIQALAAYAGKQEAEIRDSIYGAIARKTVYNGDVYLRPYGSVNILTIVYPKPHYILTTY